jgi:ACS family pantothenate transporter-like MFS transporter
MVVHRRCNNHHPHCTSVSISTLPEANVTNQNSGFFVFPDVPSRKKPRFLEESEHTLARNRLEGLTAPPQAKLSRSIFRRVFSRWHWYLFVLQWTLMDQNFSPYSTPFSLYLKANSETYSIVRINTLPTIATAISIVSAVASGLFADKTGRFWIPTVAVTVPVLIGISLLVAWDVGENGRLAAFILCGFEGGESLQPLFINGSLTRRSFNSGLPNDHELGVRRHG